MQNPYKAIIGGLIFLFFNQLLNAQAFVHPGILHSKEDLLRMKNAVTGKQEPVYSGYQLFIQNPASRFNYNMQGPLKTVGRNPSIGHSLYDDDANAAHQNAIMWAITGDKRYAAKSIEIVNAWSGTLQSITGKDAILMAGLGPFKMINAAEILRYTQSDWKEDDIRQAEKHFKGVIYPVLKDFAPFANGNWDAAAIKTMMAIAVFCNDRPMLETALRYYVNGNGNGSIIHYIVNTEGQVQESGRDQAHTQLGIGMLAECCAIAWNQRLDLYAYDQNRLLSGFEYTAKFNLGNEVPFTEWLDRTGKYHHTKISQQARGELRAVYEQVYNHYVGQMGLTAPYIQQAAEKLRPEGPGRPGADHPGYGTLYFASGEKTVARERPAAPAAVIAHTIGKEIKLKWIEPVTATSYTVRRATVGQDNYTLIAGNIKQPYFTDSLVKQGCMYRYTVTASNKYGESEHSSETRIYAGLPSPWKQYTIGDAKGASSFDGNTFTIEAGGNANKTIENTHITYRQLSGNGAVTARFVPQTNSRFAQIGLVMRDGLKENAPVVSLIIYPVKTRDMELPDWHIKLTSHSSNIAPGDTGNLSLPLSAPAVSWGRLTGNVWLRLQRSGNNFTGSFSYDGNTWKTLPSVTQETTTGLLTGLTVSSGMANTTWVLFDNVAVADDSIGNTNAPAIDLNAKHFFLFSYFTKQSGGARLALSTDGLHWKQLNGAQPVIIPQVGTEKLMRDPSIHHGKDGLYRMVWTSGWKGKDIGYAVSEDLIHWSTQTAIPVAAHIDSTSNCWAPEIFYDDLKGQYMIYWSSNVGAWKKMGSEGRIYYVTTKDFKAFTEPKILFRNGFPAGGAQGNNGPIDAYIYKDARKRYLLFYKKDDNSGVPNVYYRVGKTPDGDWGKEFGPITPSTGDEGPSVLKTGNRYCMFTDPFESDFAYVFMSKDLINWERQTTDLKMSHGTVTEISRETAIRLLKPQNPFGNALVPDMIADASIQQINGTFYCYATTDGYGQGLKTSGPPVVWKSDDFVHWSFSGSYFPSAIKQKYWAPSKAIAAGKKYFIYPTVNGFMYPAVADAPDGPFKLAKDVDSFYLPFTPATLLEPRNTKAPAGIDAEVFMDDDGQPYIFWQQRFAARLNRDMISIDTSSLIKIATKRQGYSEGPIFFKRKCVYYYLYTLGGDEKYQYAYGMSKTSPLGPFEFPNEDIITTTNYEHQIFGPGHGCVFNVPGTDDFYLSYLEFGRGSTNRQTYVNKLEFNKDGTIRPVNLNLKGVGALSHFSPGKKINVISAEASSVHPNLIIKPNQDSLLNRTEFFASQFAFDGANGSRWMAAPGDSTAWLIADLGKLRLINRSEIGFVRPTAGHAYTLEYSVDGSNWKHCGGHEQVVSRSPHTDKLNIRGRYMRVKILKGVNGIWEWNIY